MNPVRSGQGIEFDCYPVKERRMRIFVLFLLLAPMTAGCSDPSPSVKPAQKKQTVPQEKVAAEREVSFEAMKTAAENGDPRAQSGLGYAYDVGEGVTQNFKTALHWYRQAAEQGYPYAQFNLAEMIRDGDGVPQSNEDALAWYKKAAMQGHSKAQYNVAMMYVNGEGVAADNVTAYAWLVLSATGDAEGAAQARDIVGKGIGDKIQAGDALAEKLRAEIRENAK